MKKIICNLYKKAELFLLKIPLKISGKNLSSNATDIYLQFVRFGIVGLSNTIISYIIYIIFFLLFRHMDVFQRTDYLIAQIIAFILSVLWSFYWNNKMVFISKERNERSIWKSLIKTFITYSFTGLFLNSILLVLWIKIFCISELIAPVINLIFSVPLNFIINKFWTFKK